MNVLIACGGTGGHLFPGLAVAETLLARRHEVRLLVSQKAVDQTALTSAHISVRALPAVGWDRNPLRFGWRFVQAYRDCTRECDQFRPDVALGMGGFTSAPAIVAARRRRVPTLIHDSNTVPGKANRLVGRWVNRVAVGFAECGRFFPGKPVSVTGTPVRTALKPVAEAREKLGLQADRLTVLVVGGSQGAHAVNEAVARALPKLGGMQFIHLTGPRDESPLRAAYAAAGISATVMSFCNTMELAYSAADLAVARAGAATLTELAAFGLPAVLVPYPHAAGNHQWHNARVFERAGAARVVEESALSRSSLSEADSAGGAALGERRPTGQGLGVVLAELLADEASRQAMSAKMRTLAVPNAAERIADLIEEMAGNRRKQLELDLAA
jgi:UDP-N-acetylglucosamine--N-acetylmuramyl-(pentapeptide) pyrophosphoryl-undecaprenol N-acetylglucosamine transferase